MTRTLPPGQREVERLMRFGLLPFASRSPRRIDAIELRVSGDVAEPADLGPALQGLRRVDQASDSHCVTTWSCRAVRWSGVRFADLPLEDLLAPDVLLADRLEGQPLPVAHGAPLRLVAPAHYGYKSVLGR